MLQKSPTQKQEVEDIDINLKDPEVAKAAVMLQAGFRGLKARQKFKSKVCFRHHVLMIYLYVCSFFIGLGEGGAEITRIRGENRTFGCGLSNRELFPF